MYVIVPIRRADFALGFADLYSAAVKSRCRRDVGKDDRRLDVVPNGDAERCCLRDIRREALLAGRPGFAPVEFEGDDGGDLFADGDGDRAFCALHHGRDELMDFFPRLPF